MSVGVSASALTPAPCLASGPMPCAVGRNGRFSARSARPPQRVLWDARCLPAREPLQ
ncbi:hypothetical protein BSLA_01r1872 [Burkholderia stabilis]|nr:hypothetical protein BSLA_01r1872 [Burkholderia stabilis]